MDLIVTLQPRIATFFVPDRSSFYVLTTSNSVRPQLRSAMTSTTAASKLFFIRQKPRVWIPMPFLALGATYASLVCFLSLATLLDELEGKGIEIRV